VAGDTYHAAEKCVCDSVSQGNAQQDTRDLGSWNKKGETEEAVSYLIGSGIITESDISMDAEDLTIVRVWWTVRSSQKGREQD
jgi:hypothetical protein